VAPSEMDVVAPLETWVVYLSKTGDIAPSETWVVSPLETDAAAPLETYVVVGPLEILSEIPSEVGCACSYGVS